MKKGWFVAVSVTEGIAPLNCYVGEVQEVDQRGVRLTLMDWIIGSPLGYDLYIPHENIQCAYIATAQHDKSRFIEESGKWQTKMLEKNKSNKGAREDENHPAQRNAA